MSIVKDNVLFLSATSFAFNEYLEDFIFEVAKVEKVHLVANCSEGIKDFRATVHDFPFQRGILKLKEFILILRLIRLFKCTRPVLVYSISPKGGLYLLLTKVLSKEKFTWVHFYTGQVWYNKFGVVRLLLKSIDRLIGKYSDFRLIDSKSQRDFLLQEKVISNENSFVLGPGSLKGNKVYSYEDIEISKGSNLLFVGRANKEKGFDMILRFIKSNSDWLLSKGIVLNIAGLIEDKNIEKELESLDAVHYLGYVSSLRDLFLDSKILLIPSEREGFGSVVVEAGIFGVPSIGTDIVGLSDSLGNYSFKMTSNDYSEFERLIFQAYEEDSMLWEQRVKQRQAECKVFFRDRMASLFFEFHLGLRDAIK